MSNSLSPIECITYTAPCPCDGHDTTWTSRRDGSMTTAQSRCGGWSAGDAKAKPKKPKPPT